MPLATPLHPMGRASSGAALRVFGRARKAYTGRVRRCKGVQGISTSGAGVIGFSGSGAVPGAIGVTGVYGASHVGELPRRDRIELRRGSACAGREYRQPWASTGRARRVGLSSPLQAPRRRPPSLNPRPRRPRSTVISGPGSAPASPTIPIGVFSRCRRNGCHRGLGHEREHHGNRRVRRVVDRVWGYGGWGIFGASYHDRHRGLRRRHGWPCACGSREYRRLRLLGHRRWRAASGMVGLKR